jgi:hypothetical protein
MGITISRCFWPRSSCIGRLFVVTALDLARAVSFSIATILGALFVQRVTGNKLAGLAGG